MYKMCYLNFHYTPRLHFFRNSFCTSSGKTNSSSFSKNIESFDRISEKKKTENDNMTVVAVTFF